MNFRSTSIEISGILHCHVSSCQRAWLWFYQHLCRTSHPWRFWTHMVVSWNGGTPSDHPPKIGFSPIWGYLHFCLHLKSAGSTSAFRRVDHSCYVWSYRQNHNTPQPRCWVYIAIRIFGGLWWIVAPNHLWLLLNSLFSSLHNFFGAWVMSPSFYGQHMVHQTEQKRERETENKNKKEKIEKNKDWKKENIEL